MTGVGLGRTVALLVTDVQNDFLPGGPLAVRGASEILPPLNRLIAAFRRHRLPVIFSRDWHPRGHCSFRESGGKWPAHCIQRTRGARFAATLRMPPHPLVISKATRPDRDAYSAFDGTGLDRLLRRKGVRHLVLGGLATDYCILRTALGARRLRYSVTLASDAVRAVNLRKGDSTRAIRRMEHAGVRRSSSRAILRAASGSELRWSTAS